MEPLPGGGAGRGLPAAEGLEEICWGLDFLTHVSDVEGVIVNSVFIAARAGLPARVLFPTP